MRLRRAVMGLVLFTITTTMVTLVGTGTAQADDPIFVDWTSQLPSWSDQYDPNSANDCVAGKSSCIDKTIREMQRRFDPLGQSCDHNAVFSLAYLRTTQTYEWARDQAGFFNDTPSRKQACQSEDASDLAACAEGAGIASTARSEVRELPHQ